MLVSVKIPSSLQCLFTRVFLASPTCQCWKCTVPETCCKAWRQLLVSWLPVDWKKKITAVLPLIQAGTLATSPERAQLKVHHSKLCICWNSMDSSSLRSIKSCSYLNKFYLILGTLKTLNYAREGRSSLSLASCMQYVCADYSVFKANPPVFMLEKKNFKIWKRRDQPSKTNQNLGTLQLTNVWSRLI